MPRCFEAEQVSEPDAESGPSLYRPKLDRLFLIESVREDQDGSEDVEQLGH